MFKAKEKCCMPMAGSSPSCLYGLGFIGTVVYFWQTSPALGEKMFGILKAVVWPAILAFKAFEMLGM